MINRIFTEEITVITIISHAISADGAHSYHSRLVHCRPHGEDAREKTSILPTTFLRPRGRQDCFCL